MADSSQNIKQIAVLARTSRRYAKLFNGSLAGRISELQGGWGRCQLSQSPNTQSHIDGREISKIGSLWKGNINEGNQWC
jgi:hypothetical protein